MARKPRKKSAAKRKPAAQGKSRKPMTIGEEFMDAYRAMVDTVKGTGRMRKKMQRSGTDETE